MTTLQNSASAKAPGHSKTEVTKGIHAAQLWKIRQQSDRGRRCRVFRQGDGCGYNLASFQQGG